MSRGMKWIIGIVVAAVIIAGGAYAYLQLLAPSPEFEGTELETSEVRRGDIAITVAGNGTLVPAAEVSLSFSASGTLADVLVEAGDHVEAGQTLAQLDDAQAQIDLAQAELDMEIAQNTLDVTQADAELNLGWAYENLSEVQVDNNPADSDSTTEERITLEQAEQALEEALINTGGTVFGSRQHVNAWTRVQEAEDDLAIAQAEHNLVVDELEDELETAEGYIYDYQLDIEGSTGTVQLAQWDLDSAQWALELAQIALDETRLITPITGTVVEVLANIGEAVGTDSLITVVDLDAPLVVFYVDEIDLAAVQVGSPVTITLNAFPNQTFSGTVTQIDPQLVEVDESLAAQVWAAMNVPQEYADLILADMTAQVEVIAGESQGTLLVPSQAVRQDESGQSFVLVVGEGSLPQMRPVEVGLVDLTNAEILSGLEAGEMVATGIPETDLTTLEGNELPSERQDALFGGTGP